MRTPHGWLIWRAGAVLVGLLVLAVAGRDLHGAVDTQSVDLVVLHVNDQHGHLLADARGNATEGGAARLAARVAEVRAECPGRVVLLHAGDMLSKGDPLTIHYGGDVNLRFLQMLKFDAWTPGNGDFYFGIANLRRVAGLAPDVPALHANSVFRADGRRPLGDVVVKVVGGVRVGIVGVGRLNKGHWTSREIDLRDPIETARDLVPSLRSRCDLLIALTHIGFDADKRLAREVPAIDLIVGGDSHTRLDEVVRVLRPGGGEVAIVQAGEFGRFLGRVDVAMAPATNGYRVASVRACLLPMSPSVVPDPAVTQMLDGFAAPLETPVGVLAEPVLHVDGPTSPMGAYVAEAVRSGAATDLALLDTEAVKAGLNRGPVTVAQLCRVHPWRNAVARVAMTGERVLFLVESAPVYAAGCEIVRVGGQVTAVRQAGEPLYPQRVYTVAINDFLLRGNAALRDLETTAEPTGERVDTLLARRIRAAGTPAAGGKEP